MAINKTAEGFKKDAHLNWMGGPSYDIGNPIFNLRLAASSCFFGEPQYYHREGGKKSKKSHVRLSDADLKELRAFLHAVDPVDWRDKTPAQMMESAIDAALDFDPEATLQEAVRLRTEEFIRTTPQVILVRAANHPKVKKTGLVRTYAKKIVARPDELCTQLAYLIAINGKDAPVPNSLKKVWRDAFERFNEYALAKYRMESREVKLVDVMNLCHPENTDKLAKGELKTSDNTWEAIISKEGSSKETWTKALDVMGHMALLRNLRNLLEKDVDKDLFLNKLKEGVKDGKQLPFRYYSAYKAVESFKNPRVLDTIEDCLMLSLDSLPKFPGRVMSLCDNSGSARGTTTSEMGSMHICDIGNLTAILTGLTADEGYVGVFGDRLETFEVRKRSSVFELAAKADKIGHGIGGGTENGIWLFWDKAIKEKEHWDSVFVYSDMQAGHGGLYGTNHTQYSEYLWRGSRYIDVPKLINVYRNKVNPKVKVFLVQIAGYQDTIVPEFYDNTYILGGWGPGLLRFASEMSKMNQ